MSDPASLIAQAEKKLKGGISSFLRGGPNYEEACDLYANAGNAYKLQRRWNEAAQCFSKCAGLQAKQNDQSQEAHYYVEAGKVLEKVSTADTVRYYELASQLYNTNGRFSQSANLMKSVAELHENEGNQTEAMGFYKKAADLYELDEYGKTSYSNCIIKYAEFVALAKPPQLDVAIQIFENEGIKALKNSLVQFGAKAHFLKAGILQLAKGDAVTASIACERYCKLDPRFQSSREGKLLQELCAAAEQNDADKFVAALAEFDRINQLDAWKIPFLNQIKANMTSAGGAKGYHQVNEEQNVDLASEIQGVAGDELDLT